MTSPTIIQTPGVLDTAMAAFQRAFTLSAQLEQQRRELDLRRQQVESQTELEAAQRNALLNNIKLATAQADRDRQALAIVQGNIQNVMDPQKFFSVMSQIDPALLPSITSFRDHFLQGQRDAVALAEQERQSSALSAAIMHLPAGQQQKAQDLTALTKSGMPVDVAVALIMGAPARPAPTFADYTGRINAARGFMDKGMTAGEAYRMVQLPLPPGVDPNYKIPQVVAGGAGAGISQARQKVVMHLPAMEQSNLSLDLLEDKGVRISIPAQAYREALVRARGGGATAVLAALTSMGLNLALPSEQRQYVAAQMRGANAFRYIVSGQQTSDAEFAFILSYYAAGVGDDDATLLPKRVFRHAMENATRAIGDGQLNRVEALDSMIQLAKSQGADADVMATLRKMRGYAVIEDQGNTPPVISRDNPTDPNDWDAAAGAVIDSMGVQP